MPKKTFTDEQIDHVLRQAEAGVPVDELIRKTRPGQRAPAEQTFYRWKKKLKQLVADLSLDKTMLQEAIAKKL